MKLYLSSYRIGNCSAELAASVRGDKRIAVIRNALDFSSDVGRLSAGREREFESLSSLGLSPEELDLREFFGEPDQLRSMIRRFDAVWVTGGNSFILRKAMFQSGFDQILHDLASDAEFLYGGYSAGICVLTPILRGIHLVDQPEITPTGYRKGTIWDGLNLIPCCIAPHFRSDHPESELIERSVEFFITDKLPFIYLRDGEVLIESLPLSEPWSPNVCGRLD
jgi:dipeptidase E